MSYPVYETIVARGHPMFSRVSYALVLCLRDRHGRQYIHHIELFFGDDGRTLRGEVMRAARAAREGRYKIVGVRSDYMPVTGDYDRPLGGWPPRAQQLPVMAPA